MKGKKGIKTTSGRERHLPRRRGRSSADAAQIPAGIKAVLDELMPHLRDCIPETTACALIGLDERVWEEHCGRYPALRLAVKRAQAERLVEWQRTVEAGAQGWQAAATLLERRDPQNWSRSSSTATSRAKQTPLQRAVVTRGKAKKA